MFYFDQAIEFIDEFTDVDDIDDKFELVNYAVGSLYSTNKISQNAAENLLNHYFVKLNGEINEN